MIYLKRQIKRIYNTWGNDPYMYEKNENGIYKSKSYKEFIEESLSIASFLLNKNYKNKTGLLLSENNIKLMECDLAISFYVGRSAIVCREWTIKDLLDGIDEVNAKYIICSKKYENIVKELSKIKNIPYYLMDEIPNTFNNSYLDFNIKKYDDVAKIVFSSGTTGRSKGVLLSLRNIFSGYNSLQRRLHINHNDRVYMFLPLHHTYASICHFMYSLLTGHRLYLSSSTANIGKELLEVNPTVFCTVPLVLNKLYDSYKDKIGIAFGKNIRFIVSGGAPMSKEMRKIFKDSGLSLLQTYAMTETSSSFTLSYPNSEDYESSGELYEDIDVKIDKPNKEGIGEIIVKGDNVFKGYTDTKLNKKVFDNNGYFHTGDLGYLKDNKLYVKGRKKKILITSNGENVDSSYIEDKILNLSNNINAVKAYVKDDKLAVNLYVLEDEDYEDIINSYNNNAPIYEQIEFVNIYKDSIDTRLKQ